MKKNKNSQGNQNTKIEILICSLFMLLVETTEEYLLQEAKEECIEPVFALSELGQVPNSNL